MSFLIELTDEAREDISLAVQWYNLQKGNLGILFITYLNNAFIRIKNIPTANKKVYRQVRQAALQKFPYVILYKPAGNLIIIYAVFHTKRNPKAKIRRIKK